MKGEGPSYWERKRGRVQCKHFGEEMTLIFLAGHMQTQNVRVAKGRHILAATAPGEEPRTYKMDFLTTGGARNCPVEGCPGRAVTGMLMRVKFIHHHVWDTVVILEEGKIPQPR